MAGSSLLTVDNILVFGLIGGVGAYFMIPNFKQAIDDALAGIGNGGNGNGNGNGNGEDPCALDPNLPECQGNGNGDPPAGDCDSFGGDCKGACEHGCEGNNCQACLTACSASCSDTKSSSSCSYTCDNGFCRSWRDKGCTNSCSKCKNTSNSLNVGRQYSPTDYYPISLPDYYSAGSLY